MGVLLRLGGLWPHRSQSVLSWRVHYNQWDMHVCTALGGILVYLEMQVYIALDDGIRTCKVYSSSAAETMQMYCDSQAHKLYNYTHFAMTTVCHRLGVMHDNSK